MNTLMVSIHPNHPSASARYTLMADSRLSSGYIPTGTYYSTLAEAESARAELSARINTGVVVAAIVNTHPLLNETERKYY